MKKTSAQVLLVKKTLKIILNSENIVELDIQVDTRECLEFTELLITLIIKSSESVNTNILPQIS